MTAPVSVALVTRNGADTLPAVLRALAAQELDAEVELVAVDSGSQDGTLELLAAQVDRVIPIEPAAFDHGATRNLAIGSCRGELVVLLVQDAVPAGPRWLAELVAPFADRRVAGSYARQRPRPGAGRLERWNLERWLAAQPEPRLSAVAGRAAFDALSPVARFEACVFDNVCSALRRSVWREIPFRPTAIAEDLAWAREVLLAGHRIAYAPAAVVVHSHHRSLRYELERTRLVHRRLGELFGLRLVPDRRCLTRAVTATLGEHLRVVSDGWGRLPSPPELARAIGLAVVWPLGQYLGGRDAARRRRSSRGA